MHASCSDATLLLMYIAFSFYLKVSNQKLGGRFIISALIINIIHLQILSMDV